MDLITLILGCSMYAHNATVNAMIQLNSNNTPLMVSGKPFPTQASALAYAKKLRAEGKPFSIGLMQIPSRWLSDYPVSLEELLRPCKNVAIATQILITTDEKCNGDEICALSIYKTGDAEAGIDYANQIIEYASQHPIVRPPPLE